VRQHREQCNRVRSTVTHSQPTATQRRSEDSCRSGESTSNCALETAGKSSLTDNNRQSKSEMDKCLRSRSASAARGEDAAVATSNITAQGTNSELGLEQNVTNVEIVDNSKVTSNNVENLNLANQLQSMFNTFRIAMQEDIAKLTSNVEAKFNK